MNQDVLTWPDVVLLLGFLLLSVLFGGFIFGAIRINIGGKK
jgi:hypothetical protein